MELVGCRWIGGSRRMHRHRWMRWRRSLWRRWHQYKEGGAVTSSTGEAQQCPDAAEAGKKPEAIEQEQPFAAEPDRCVQKVRTRAILETPTQKQRDIHKVTHLSPVSCFTACECWKAADNPPPATTGLNWTLLRLTTLILQPRLGLVARG